MEIFKHGISLTPAIIKHKLSNKTIGFVPTMGALHQGHISLVKRAKEQCDIVVVSIFVNPTQFNDPKDLALYPRTENEDIQLLKSSGCDLIYMPDPTDLYPNGIHVSASFNLHGLDNVLEGASRPGHFAGVVQVVKTLCEITLPNKLFLGQKDLQQCMILSQQLKELKPNVEVIRCPIVREEFGLAMSSRNARLPSEIRKRSSLIFKTLLFSQSLIHVIPVAEICTIGKAILNAQENLQVDYFEFITTENLNPSKLFDAAQECAFVTAVYANGVRLIDNIIL